jgi:hypothetical protein
LKAVNEFNVPVYVNIEIRRKPAERANCEAFNFNAPNTCAFKLELTCGPRQFMDILLYQCKNCPDYTYVSTDGMSCKTPTCTGREIISIEGKCVPCPDYMLVDESDVNRRTCKLPTCDQPNTKISMFGICEPCPQYTYVSPDQRSCMADTCNDR